MNEYYPGHLESAALSCGVSGPAGGGCVSGNVCDLRALLSAWQGTVSENESTRGNALEMHSQNLEITYRKRKCLLCIEICRTAETSRDIMGVTSNSDGVAETTGLGIEVECCQTGNFMLFTGNAPPQAILVQRTPSTPSSSSRGSSCSTCF